MITEYIAAALAKAHYEIIEDEEPYYGEIPELPGVWASGKTLEECRHNLKEVIEGWIIVRLKKGLSIPPIDGHQIAELEELQIGGLRRFGFDGPYRGGKHLYMVKGDLVLTIPNPHRKEISVDLLRRILKRAGIAKEEWLGHQS
jgi:predicted RNase H-like HicB family nuclease